MTFSSKAIAVCALMILLGIGTLSYWGTVRDDRLEHRTAERVKQREPKETEKSDES